MSESQLLLNASLWIIRNHHKPLVLKNCNTFQKTSLTDLVRGTLREGRHPGSSLLKGNRFLLFMVREIDLLPHPHSGL